LQEGQIWEAAMYAAHHKVDNLISFVDCNGQQIDGPTDEVMGLGDLAQKWTAFGWQVHLCDGHDFDALRNAVSAAKEARGNGKPKVILMKTAMGKGSTSWKARMNGMELLRMMISLQSALGQLEETLGDY
jgi:transketolase